MRTAPWPRPTRPTSTTSAEDAERAELNVVTSDAAFFRLASADLLAAETQDYVPKLIASAIIAKAPGAIWVRGTAVVEPFAYDSIVVTDVTGLDVDREAGGDRACRRSGT